tara:strand:- start:192 stop:566 length:375 start_codon:yes stop_codon:yes gene_type:complete
MGSAASCVASGVTGGTAGGTAGGAAGGAVGGAADTVGGTALGGGADAAVLPGAGKWSSEEEEEDCSERVKELLLVVRSKIGSATFECPPNRPAKPAAHAKPADLLTGTATATTVAEPRETGGLE